jgi:hypothetical protein
MKIVVAQDRDAAVSKAPGPPEDLQGVRASIDQIADQPEPVVIGSIVDALKEVLERLPATVDVSDCVRGHRNPGVRCLRRGVGRRLVAG